MTEYNITKKDKVLFVDDEQKILNSLRRSMISEPFKKFFASDADQALKIMEQNPDIAVIVSDLRMPGMNGIELLKIIKNKYPKTIRIVLTAYSQVSTILAAIKKGYIFHYLTKPWKYEKDFLPILKTALKKHHLLKERDNLIKKLEKNNKHKEEVLNKLTKEIIPYISDVIETTYELFNYEDNFINEIGKDLNNRGKKILATLRNIEKNLKRSNYEKK